MRYLGNNIKMIINNLSVSLSDEGPYYAPAIIFIHGFPFNKHMWNMQVEELKDDYRVIAYDIRGHGDSDSGNEEFSIKLFVKDLVCLMDALKIDKAVLCGLSMGGYIALNAIENYPERFYALILSDTQCSADSPEAMAKRLKTIETLKRNKVKRYINETIINLFAPASFKTKGKEIAAVREMIENTSIQTLCNAMLALSMRKETCRKLSKIKVPVLIIVGKEDIITPPSSSWMVYEKIKDSYMIIIENAGHLANIENPDDFNYQMRMFISSVKIDME